MTMTVVLYKGCKFDGNSRMSNYSTESSRRAYLSTLTSKTYTVNTVRLGEPLALNTRIGQILEYNYGYLDYGDGIRYYFAVVDLTMRTETLTDVHYQIDAYETASGQFGLQLGRYHVTRCVHDFAVKPSTIHGPDAVEYTPVDTWAQYGTVVYVRYDETYKTFFFGTAKRSSFFPSQIVNGEWMVNLPVDTPSQIYYAGYLPFDVTITNGTEYATDPNAFIVTESSIPNHTVAYTRNYLTGDISSVDCIRDTRGNVLYSEPSGMRHDITTIRVYWGVTSIFVVVELAPGLESPNGRYTHVVIPSEPLDVLVDSSVEYFARQRQADIDNRRISNEKQNAQGVANLGQSVMGGAMTGIGIGPVGIAGGAVAGLASGVTSTLGNAVINEVYGRQEQAVLDRSANLQYDNLHLIGGMADGWLIRQNAGVYRANFDKYTAMIVASDEESNGVYCDEYGLNLVLTDYVGPIRADVEVLGNVPSAWKDQIYRRFINGVYIT